MGGLKPTTLANYERYVSQHIVGSKLGAMQLSDVRRSHVNAFLAELTKAGRGAVTVRRVLAVVRMVFSTAVRDELVGSNQHSWRISQQCRTPTLKLGNQPISQSSCSGVVTRGRDRCLRRLSTQVLRRGEIAGLHWADVNLAAGTIVVRHNRVSIDGRVQEQTTKPVQGGARCRSQTPRWLPYWRRSSARPRRL